MLIIINKTMQNTILSRIRNRLVKAPSMLSLKNSKEFLHSINSVAFRLLSLASGKMLIGARLQRLNKFLALLLKIYRHHGSVFVVQWLKASHTAIQRRISSDPVHSLRELVPNLPLPRLINGLPSFIGSNDRAAIKRGHVGTIRFWLTITSLYRVLNCATVLKLETISKPYGGSETALDLLKFEILDIIQRNKLERPLIRLQANMLHKTTAAGPNYSNSASSLLTDAYVWKLFPELRKVFDKYCLYTGSQLGKFLDHWSWMADHLYDMHGYDIFNIGAPYGGFSKLMLGKLAFKVEAAGKVRVFAIVDSWTQSLLAPLHKDLFSFLKGLPNDGTFDQEASFKRCQVKAMLANEAYAFDLTSATDRLPIALQTFILDYFYIHKKSPEFMIGELWAKLLVGRKYIVRSKLYPDFRGDEFEYGTGQPMGCLSSWAMLAITHHFIVQVAATRVYGPRKWFSKYEVLGDDIVIFDKYVAMEYLAIMKSLDVGINLSKSLISEQLQTVEFAKRTSFGGKDVSGLSWKQALSENTLAGRVSFALLLLRKGYIENRSMLVRAIASSRYIKFLDIFQPGRLNDEMKFSIANILGSFVESDKLTLGSVVNLLMDPSFKGNTSRFKPSVPITKSLQTILDISAMKFDEMLKGVNRFENFMHSISPVRVISSERIVSKVHLLALHKAEKMLNRFQKDYEKLLEAACNHMLNNEYRNPITGHMEPKRWFKVLSKTQQILLKTSVEFILLRDAKTPDVLELEIKVFKQRLSAGKAQS